MNRHSASLHRSPTLRSLALLFIASSSHASIGEKAGFHSETTALGGATVGSRAPSSSSAYENPARMSLPAINGSGDSRALFHWSAIYSKPSFKDIDSVLVENEVNSDVERFDRVDTDYPSIFGQSAGATFRSKDSVRRWSAGAVVYLPLDRLALVDSGESFVPEYSLYRGRDQRPEFHVAVSGMATERLSLGLGLQFGAKLDLGTTLFLNQGQGTASSLRISASLKTKVTPIAGLSFLASDRVSFGLTVRMPSSQPQTLRVDASARAIGSVQALDFSFPAVSTMYYDPLSIQAGTEWKHSDRGALFFQIDYQGWSRFKSPSLLILDPQTSACSPNCGVKFSEGKNLLAATRDLWVPRIGHVWKNGNSEFRLAYVYRNSIYRSLPSDAGNAIDPNEHRLAVGFGWGIRSFPIFDAPGRIDLHGVYSHFPYRNVEKSPGDENGTPARRKIGSPGYPVGGHAVGAGISLRFEL